MCRLRTNFARLGAPLQGLHKGKHANQAAPVGNAPLLVLRTTFLLKGSMSQDSQVAALPYESCSFATPKGALLPALSYEMLMGIMLTGEQISPTGGDAAYGGRRGAFPTGEDRLCGFPLALLGGCEGFIIRGAFLMSRLPPSCRLGLTAFPLTYCLFCAHSAENARVGQSWPLACT